jgi:hypothetical protein
VSDLLYRYEDEHYDGSAFVRLRTFKVVRRTRCGAWVVQDFGDFQTLDNPRFVLTGARRAYARPTRGEALESFRARKRRQISICLAQAESAKWALRAADTIEVP